MTKSTWKQKIHPGLVDFVRSYLEFIENATMPDKQVTDETSKKISASGLMSFRPFYDEGRGQALNTRLGTKMMKVKEKGVSIETFGVEMGKGLSGEMILYLLFVLLDMVSQVTYKKSLQTLYEEARAGNDESLFKLLRVDKTLFDHEWLRKRTLQEMFKANNAFFKKLGDAIKGEPPIEKMRRGKLKFILYMFWSYGLNKLTIPELAEFLESCGFELEPDLETLRKFINREIKPLFKSS